MLRDITFEHITVHNAREAGQVHGIAESPIQRIAFRDVELTAESDFDIKHAEAPIFERVVRLIHPGVGPQTIPN